MRLVTWNIARHAPETAEARLMIERIAETTPDVICLTQAHEGSLAGLGGHALTDVGGSWGGETPTERKVVLWSKAPLVEAKTWPRLSALGGAVSAVTETPLGKVRVFGVCTPYPFASPGGATPRPPVWSMHIDYLEALGEAVKEIGHDMPSVVAGDFNQYLPLSSGTWTAHHRMMTALGGYSPITTGDITPIGEGAMDHVFVSKHLRAAKVRGISRFDAAGKPLSDHFGLRVALEPGGIQVFD